MGQQSDEIEEGLTDRLKVPVWVKLAIVAVILAGSYLYANNSSSLVGVKENLADGAADDAPWRVSCRQCGVRVEEVSWASGRSVFTRTL